MITAVIPTLDAERTLPAALAALVPAAIDGLVTEVIVVDGGSMDATRRIAEEMGARMLATEPGRGAQLKAGATEARGRWLLFLHADTVLSPGWEREVEEFVTRSERESGTARAAAFSYALDDTGLMARWAEAMVRLRCHLFALPYGDQGLLIPRQLYQAIGGYQSMMLMEDVDIVRRLTRRRLTILRSIALTSAQRYRAEGYLRRIVRNQICLVMYFAGVPVTRIARFYTATRPRKLEAQRVKSA